MNLKDALKNSPQMVRGPKGAMAYASTLDANLDYFYGASRNQGYESTANLFERAYQEDPVFAIAGLLSNLDIRGGKGERKVFKETFEYLCKHHPDEAQIVLTFIPELGRWDYVLTALGTPINNKALKMIAKQLEEDLTSAQPSLLAKWLPSLRTHKKNNPQARKLAKDLGLSQEQYRRMLSKLRKKIKVTERFMSENNWKSIDFDKVPTKAMLKYRHAFGKHLHSELEEYLESVAEGTAKMNTKGLLCYEVIRAVLENQYFPGLKSPYSFADTIFSPETIEFLKSRDILETMWEEQEDFLKGEDSNLLVMADTSGSMTSDNGVPLYASLGLAFYIAERNHGIFKDHFLTFSTDPIFQEIKGSTIKEKLANIKVINESTDIDKAFLLILETALENKVEPKDMPTKLIILSDMAFDYNVTSQNGTNFEAWKKMYNKAGYPFPQIIFWNLSFLTFGAPTTVKEDDVIMVSGFSPVFLREILHLENINASDALKIILNKYVQMYLDRKAELNI